MPKEKDGAASTFCPFTAPAALNEKPNLGFKKYRNSIPGERNSTLFEKSPVEDAASVPLFRLSIPDNLNIANNF